MGWFDEILKSDEGKAIKKAVVDPLEDLWDDPVGTLTEPWESTANADPTGGLTQLYTDLGLIDDPPGPSFTERFGDLAEGPSYIPDRSSFEMERYEELKNKYIEGIGKYGERGAPRMTAAEIDTLRSDELRKNQMGILAHLGDIRQGRIAGPTRAGLLGQMTLEKGIQQGAALRGKAGGTGLAAVGAAGEKAIAGAAGTRAAEIAESRRQAFSLMGKGRGQDIGLAESQAGLTQGATLANQQAILQQTAMNDAMVKKNIELGMTLEQAQLEAFITMENLKQEQIRAEINARTAIMEAEAEEILREEGEEETTAATIFSKSDKNLKKNIKSEDAGIDSFMNHLNSYSYNYKDQAHGKGRRHGVMAQDIEKSPLGREMVIDMADGKAVDMNKGVSAALSGLARLNKRLNKLEDK